MAAQSIYEYTIQLSYVDGGNAYPIEPEYIKSLIIDYDFVNNVSPVAFLSVNLDLDMYNRMDENQGYNNVLLVINKFVSNVPNAARETYIRKQLRYFLPKKGIDFEDKDLSYKDKREVNSLAYRRTIIGLIDMDAININNTNINQIFKKTTLEAIIHKYTNIPIIKEPFDNNPSIKSLVIPPTDSVSGFLKYLNQRYCFYKSDFRLFFDYSYNCLISNRGTMMDVKDGTYNNVVIKITSQMNDPKDDSNIDGVLIDHSQKVYMIQVNSNEFDADINKLNPITTNQLQIIGTDGTSTKTDITYDITADGATSSDGGIRNKVIRTNEVNPDYADVLSRIAYSEAFVISINKAGADNSILVPYKQFSIKFPDEYSGYNGDYILISKKEYYARVDDIKFRCMTMATFRRSE